MPNAEQAALFYTSLGWSVLPLHNPLADGSCSCGRKTCSSVGKHPRTSHGVHDATTDRSQIKDWWRRWPQANVGVATGAASGLIALDIDPRNGGDASYRALVKEHGRSAASLIANTGGGGRHLFYAYNEAPVVYKPGKGIEIKSDGGYVAVAPSLHASGKRYVWRERPRRGLQLSDVPPWALGVGLHTGTGRNKAPIDPKRVLRQGERDNELIRIAGQQRRLGYGEAEIYALLSTHNRMYCEPPKPDADVKRIAHSAMRWEPEPLVVVETELWMSKRRKSSKRSSW